MEPPKPNPEKGVALAVDALAACLFGAKQTDGLPVDAAANLAVIIGGCFPEVDREAIDNAILARPTRSYK